MMAYLQENDSVNMSFWIKKKERLGKRMYRKKSRGWYKHKDFILIDLICLFNCTSDSKWFCSESVQSGNLPQYDKLRNIGGFISNHYF